MMRSLLRAVIERATVTAASRARPAAYVDAVLLRAAEILPFEEVQVVNVSNGEVFRTWVEPAPEGGGAVEIFAGERHPFRSGDLVTIAAFGVLHDGQTLTHAPRLVTVDAENRLLAAVDGVVGFPGAG